MIRIEVIPYSNLDERYELSNRLAEARCKNKFKKLKDLGNCFYIEHFGMTNNIRVWIKMLYSGMHEYDMEEKEYTDIEEMEVIKEIRLGIALGEIDILTTRESLIDWFARLQCRNKEGWCENITCIDLIEIAIECGLKIKEWLRLRIKT